jgi:hypothetical protein
MECGKCGIPSRKPRKDIKGEIMLGLEQFIFFCACGDMDVLWWRKVSQILFVMLNWNVSGMVCYMPRVLSI